MSRRTRPQEEAEARSDFDLEEDKSYTVMPIGFTSQWLDSNGDGRKDQNTGRLFIVAHDKKYQSEEEFDRTDPRRFKANCILLVLTGPDAGKTGKLGCGLQDLIIDPLGQGWNPRYGGDKGWRSAFSKLLIACGLSMKAGEIADWQDQVDEYVEALAAKHPYMLLPVPAIEQMAEYGLEGEPLPGWTRELVLRGLTSVFLRREFVLQCKTKLSEGRVVFDHESVQAQDEELLPTVRAKYRQSEAVMEVLGTAKALSEDLWAKPISTARPGMPFYEEIDDLLGQPDRVPFSEPPEHIIAKEAMWGHVRRFYKASAQEQREQIARVLMGKGMVVGVDTFEKLSLQTAYAAYSDVMSLGVAAVGEYLQADEATVIRDAGLIVDAFVEPVKEAPEEL